MAATFEWDRAKAARNYATHGVTFDEASTVFGDPLGRIVDDSRHSRGEERFVIIGLSGRSRLLAVMFTERRERIRLISARPVTRAERNNYEESAR
ncbi:MAG: BrnT family toxin [Gemmatimonadota bacterium]|nr:BrnT family toxin [Gemmatimonadota bacterium]